MTDSEKANPRKKLNAEDAEFAEEEKSNSSAF
jgi:hypothetical protein